MGHWIAQKLGDFKIGFPGSPKLAKAHLDIYFPAKTFPAKNLWCLLWKVWAISHSSVDSSGPYILQSRAQMPSTQSMLLQNLIDANNDYLTLIWENNEKVKIIDGPKF